MAKLERGVRSAAVREYLKDNPNASPKDIVAALKAKGVKVSVALASAIKYNKGKKKARVLRRVARTTVSANGSLDFEKLIEAKKLVDQLGGVEEAKKAIELLELLR